ncbi:MAG: hypothetical protein LBD22_04815 [Spirochaetaceae bacterium]|jgi:class 3 adenylate cyclase|nr:hypothetical protein [Spirochaetaceae bacterium]
MSGLDFLRRTISALLPVLDAALEFSAKNALIILPSAGAASILVVVTICVLHANAARKRNTVREAAIPHHSCTIKPADVPDSEYIAPKVRASADEAALRHLTILQARFGTLDALNEDTFASASSLLHSYFDVCAESVAKTRGRFEAFTDGTVNAVWGEDITTGSQAHDALNAVRAALLIRIAMSRLNRDRTANSEMPFTLVLGLSSGKVLSCPGGTGARRYLFGETGILALKAREAAERNAVDIVMTAKTWRLVKEYVLSEELKPLRRRKGFPVRLFAVINLRAAPGTAQPSPVTLSQLRNLGYT